MDDDVKRKQARTRGLLARCPPHARLLPAGPGRSWTSHSLTGPGLPRALTLHFPALGLPAASCWAPLTPPTPRLTQWHSCTRVAKSAKEVLEDMLSSLGAPPAEPPGPLGPLGPLGAPEGSGRTGRWSTRRQSVMGSAPFPNS